MTYLPIIAFFLFDQNVLILEACGTLLFSRPWFYELFPLPKAAWLQTPNYLHCFLDLKP